MSVDITLITNQIFTLLSIKAGVHVSMGPSWWVIVHVIDSVFKGQGGGSMCVHYCTRKTHQWLLTIQHLSVSEIGVQFLCPRLYGTKQPMSFGSHLNPTLESIELWVHKSISD